MPLATYIKQGFQTRPGTKTSSIKKWKLLRVAVLADFDCRVCKNKQNTAPKQQNAHDVINKICKNYIRWNNFEKKKISNT